MKYLVSHKSHNKKEITKAIEGYGRIIYDSSIINVIGVEATNDNIEKIKMISGVTRVDEDVSGRITY